MVPARPLRPQRCCASRWRATVWVPITLSQLLTWCLPVDREGWSSGSGCAEAPGQAVKVINSAATEFNAVVVLTNDPSRADQDYATIGSDLGQVQQYIQAGDWVDYYITLAQVRSDIEAARADGTLTDPNN
jgi:hypothetical protein